MHTQADPSCLRNHGIGVDLLLAKLQQLELKRQEFSIDRMDTATTCQQKFMSGKTCHGTINENPAESRHDDGSDSRTLADQLVTRIRPPRRRVERKYRRGSESRSLLLDPESPGQESLIDFLREADRLFIHEVDAIMQDVRQM